VSAPSVPDVGLDAASAARIGPNAITRVAEALTERHGGPLARHVFATAELSHHLVQPPEAMVPEADVVALHRAVRSVLVRADADAVMRDAGERTARYLLARRIPKPAQAVLAALPARLAARLLLALIVKHAWTFAGSARLRVFPGRPARVVFEGSPFAAVPAAAAPVCGFYVGTFETLFQRLVHPAARVEETGCAAVGAPVCTLRLSW
jgi:divinyl protochlorophyllide a 8-vinyl-reductase